MIPNPEFRSRGFGIGISYFGLDREIQKILIAIPGILGFYGFVAIGIFSRFSKNLRDFWDFFESQDFYLRDLGFFRDILGISYPRDRDFFVDEISRQKANSSIRRSIFHTQKY